MAYIVLFFALILPRTNQQITVTASCSTIGYSILDPNATTARWFCHFCGVLNGSATSVLVSLGYNLSG